MGLMDFIKGAGAKIFGRDDEPPKTEAPQGPTPQEVAAYHNKRKAKLLKDAVAIYEFDVEELEIVVDGDTATLSGKVGSQGDKEKIVLTVGNTHGIAHVNDDALEVTTPEPAAQHYTVQPGDSLSKIAKHYYGNAMKYPVIFEANKPMLTDPDKIYPGQVLRIPPLEAEKAD